MLQCWTQVTAQGEAGEGKQTSSQGEPLCSGTVLGGGRELVNLGGSDELKSSSCSSDSVLTTGANKSKSKCASLKELQLRRRESQMPPALEKA